MTHMRATHVQITDFSETDREPLRPSGMADILFCLIPAMAAVALCIWFRPLLTSGLWWDEQWRAYHVLLPGFHLDLGGTYAPTSPAWLLVDKLFVVLLGVREWVLRIPSVVAWVLIGPLTYRLSRRVMGRLASLVAGIALGVTPAVLYFGTELKPYATETLATVAIILAWAKARETEGKGRLLWYGVIALVSLLSVPAIFVVAPLLALDAIRAARNLRSKPRDSCRSLAIVAATSAAVILPLAAMVLPQPAGDEYRYFPFLPASFFQAIEIAARDIGAFLAAAWTSASMIKTDTRSVRLAAPSHPLFACAEWGVALLVVLGAWHLRRNLVGVGLTWVLGGGLVLQVIASRLHVWPLGIARVNLFMLPTVYVLTVAGLACAWNVIRKSRTLAPRAAAVPVLCAGVGLLGAMLAQNTVTTSALHEELPLHRWAENLRSIVADARNDAGAGAIAVVEMDGGEAGFFAEPKGATRGLGWIVYMDRYSYSRRVGREIPLSNTFFADIAQAHPFGLDAFMAGHRQATTVVEYTALGGLTIGVADGSVLTADIRAFGYVPYWYRTYEDSGQLTIWRR
jgi:Dolichyl-phosphate-mannose-protein mannosyltransferase